MKSENLKEKGKVLIIESISNFTNILFAVVIGFVLSDLFEVLSVEPSAKRLEAFSLYFFILLYMFFFWLAANIETNLIKEYESFSLLEGIVSGLFGIAVVSLTYYMIKLLIENNLAQVFFLFFIYDVILLIANIFLYVKGKKYENSEFKEYYRSNSRVLIYFILLFFMYFIYLLAKYGYIQYAIYGVYLITIISEIFIYKLRNETIYRLLRE